MCFFVLYIPERFWVWLWSQSLLFKQVRNPRSTLHGWRGLPHAVLAVAAPVTLRITSLGTWHLRGPPLPGQVGAGGSFNVGWVVGCEVLSAVLVCKSFQPFCP